MIKTLKYISLALALLISLSGFSAKDYFDKDGYPVKPRPERLVNIVPPTQSVLSKQQINQLEQRLANFSNNTSTQIALVVVNSLNGNDIAEMATEIGHRWGIGQKGKDNGIVILLKPKSAGERGQVFIATGYGLEGVIPDVIAKQIVENEMIPHFKQKNMYGGIVAAVGVLEGLALKEFSAQQYVQKHKKRRKKGSKLFNILPLIIFFALFYLLRRGRGRTYGSSGASGFLTGMFIGSMFRGGGGSSWDDFSSGGGGFGGFGGGGFGGGGAGGSW